jgi:hypothetical protein
MNVIPIGETPDNIQTYVKPPVGDQSPEELEAWLAARVKEGVHKIHIPECFIYTVKHISDDAAQNGYKIMQKQLLGLTAQAEFFLERAA